MWMVGLLRPGRYGGGQGHEHLVLAEQWTGHPYLRSQCGAVLLYIHQIRLSERDLPDIRLQQQSER